MPKDFHIRDIEPGDHAKVLELNRGEVQWTSPMNRERLEHLLGLTSYRKVIFSGNDIAGFLLAMNSNSPYDNDNFRWFSAHYSRYLYIDRIVIDQSYVGHGAGRWLYTDLFDYTARSGIEHVVCEYNLAPLNIASQAFHQRMAFRELGQRSANGDARKLLSMQSRSIAPK